MIREYRKHFGFTIVEVAAALLLLSLMLGSVMVLMNRYVEAVMDMRLEEEAFELARSNMEMLLSETKLSQSSDYGTSETNPAIDWETVVEPFYEPVTSNMWIRAVCKAGYTDTAGEYQEIELEHWITSLTRDQIKQVVAQQKIEAEYLELIQDGYLTDTQQATIAYLEQEGLDVEKYEDLLNIQRKKKLEYLDKKGFDGYDEFVEELEEEEDKLLEKIGMDFDEYNEFAKTYVPKVTSGGNSLSPNGADDAGNASENSGSNETGNEPADSSSPNENEIPWDDIPKQFWPLFKALGFEPPSG